MRFWKGSRNACEVAVLQMGMGPESATRSLAWASERVSPRVVLATGCAGALAVGLRPGELVIAEEVCTRGLSWPTSAEWTERCSRASRGLRRKAHRGRLLASFSMLTSAEEKKRAGTDSGALAVAMEDGAVAEWALARGVEFVSVRVILDPVEMAIPREISSITGPSGGVRPHRLLAAVVRRPGLLADFLRLASALRACRSTLESLHRRLLDDLGAR